MRRYLARRVWVDGDIGVAELGAGTLLRRSWKLRGPGQAEEPLARAPRNFFLLSPIMLLRVEGPRSF